MKLIQNYRGCRIIFPRLLYFWKTLQPQKHLHPVCPSLDRLLSDRLLWDHSLSQLYIHCHPYSKNQKKRKWAISYSFLHRFFIWHMESRFCIILMSSNRWILNTDWYWTSSIISNSMLRLGAMLKFINIMCTWRLNRNLVNNVR